MTFPHTIEISILTLFHDQIKARGGNCIPVQCDHSKDEDIKSLFARINRDQEGQLDVLVNNAYSAVNVSWKNLWLKSAWLAQLLRAPSCRSKGLRFESVGRNGRFTRGYLFTCNFPIAG
jgi:hypothetical protein